MDPWCTFVDEKNASEKAYLPARRDIRDYALHATTGEDEMGCYK